MGMYLGLSTLGDDNIRKVLEDPPLIWKVVAPDDPEAYEGATKGKPGFLARLFGGRGGGSPSLELSEEELVTADLDKAWHGIHFMLTRTAWEGEWPLGFLLLGGTTVGDIDVGYGPARVLTSSEVRQVAGALVGFDERTLRGRFDPDAMMKLEIYPEIWDRDPSEDDTLGYCVEYFDVLKGFIARAAERGMGLVVYLS